MILQSDNGGEFVGKLIKELKDIWTDLKLVNGSPRHPQSQGSVERANQDLEVMVANWMTDENCPNWTIGIHIVCHKKNNRYHSGINAVPYRLRYGQRCRVGINTLNLPQVVLTKIFSEQDLRAAVSSSRIITYGNAGVDHEEPAAPVEQEVLAQHGNQEEEEMVAQEKVLDVNQGEIQVTAPYNGNDQEQQTSNDEVDALAQSNAILMEEDAMIEQAIALMDSDVSDNTTNGSNEEQDDVEVVEAMQITDNGLCCCGCGLNASGSHHFCTYTNRRVMAFCLVNDSEEGFGSSGICKGCSDKKPSPTDGEVVKEKQCCCGCGTDASSSILFCSYSNRKVMALCLFQGIEEGSGTSAICKGCYDKVNPEGDSPVKGEMWNKAHESVKNQGRKMQIRAEKESEELPASVGTVV